MEMDDNHQIRPVDIYEENSSEEEDFGHQYDDYEDLFSNETESLADDGDETEIGKYLEMEPGLQKQVAQLIMLRRHLDELQEKLSECEFTVIKSREELGACQTRLRALTEERDVVEQSIVIAQEKNNIASHHRLVSKKEKLCRELENECKIEKEIQGSLQNAELNLAKVELEQRHYTQLAEQVLEKEEQVTLHKQKMAKYRLKKEERTSRLLNGKFKRAQKELEKKVEERRLQQEQVARNAIVNHRKAVAFLKLSLGQVRESEAIVHKNQQLEVERRVQTIISLKNNISSDRENQKVLQARDAAFEKKRKEAENKEREQILNEGGNPELVLLQRKRIAQFEKQREELKLKENLNRTKIVESLLDEEENFRKKRIHQPYLWDDKEEDKRKRVVPVKKKSIESKIELNDKDEPVFLEQAKYMQGATIRKSVLQGDLSTTSSDVDLSHSPVQDEIRSQKSLSVFKEEENLAQPEFKGLWDHKHKPYKVDDDGYSKPVGGTKMEKQILEKLLTQQREGIVVKQVAAGREFKGQPFYSKPDVIHFKNLDVGKSYRKKIVITNVSYSINFIKLTGLSEHLKDFISIEFNPPGQMSAGMSCDMFVTFKPMINEDLIGEVFFLAQTGSFSIPLKCTVKKCDLSVDVDTIDFGAQVVGETIRRSVTLVNKGALGTRFEFIKIPDKSPTTYTMETSLGRLTTADTLTPSQRDISETQKATATTTKRADDTEDPPRTADTSLGKTNDYHDVTAERYDDIEGIMSTQGKYSRGDGDDIVFETSRGDYDASMIDELKVGQVMSGEIEPFSSVKLDIIFAPCIPGDIQARFRISFLNIESPPLNIKASAVAIDVPVWLDRQNVDLKVCMYDRLYQDQIVIHNRANTALRLNFEVPKELRNHMELLPRTGYIQAKSTFTAQLKFLPRLNLVEDAGGLFDPETGILECPMVIRVANQTRPVPFVVNAVVTSSDLEFDLTEIDFGCCGIHESVITRIKLRNRSILPQLFGFVGIPDFVDVQPNDGFGTILPLETLEIDIIVSVKRARVYDFTVTCRSGINRDFPIHCKAIGVHPPLELSDQLINFAATALNDVSVMTLHVINSHTSANEFTHPVPRIGKGEIVPVGPTSFEFCVPDDAPILITPAVGTVEPGEKCHVTVEFSPKLTDYDIRKEACVVIERQKEERVKEEQDRIKREAEELAAKQEEEKHAKGKKTPKTAGKPKTAESTTKSRRSSAKSIERIEDIVPTPDMVDENSVAYKAASAALARRFPGSFHSYIIPCFVAPGKCSENSNSPLPYKEANTQYLEIRCPVVHPPVVAISNHGHNLTDFGQISIGRNNIKEISIQNITNMPVELFVSSLDTSGPFQILNALRTLKPDETHTLLVSFTPNAGKVFYEVLNIISPIATLHIALTGRGVTPVIKLQPSDGTLDFGHVVKGEAHTKTFMLENQSSLAVEYSVRLDSNSLLRHEKLQQLPEFIEKDEKKRKSLVGTQNYSGSCVFNCVPCKGVVKPSEEQEIAVTFQPDHESLHFSDGARVVLFNTEEAHVIHLTGKAHDHMMVLDGYDPLDVSIESLAASGKNLHKKEEGIIPPQDIFLSFKSKVTDEGFTPVSRNIDVHCLKNNTFAARKNGEWIVENFQESQGRGFTMDPMKSSVDVDSYKSLTITWTPPEGHDPNATFITSFQLTLKGDVTMAYNIVLSGLISFS